MKKLRSCSTRLVRSWSNSRSSGTASKKMGSMKDLMSMIPGMDKALKGVEVSDDAFKPIEAIISSMTPQERSNPSLLNGSRKNRIAKGSGTSIVEVNRFLKQFEQTSKMMKKMQQMQGLRRR